MEEWSAFSFESSLVLRTGGSGSVTCMTRVAPTTKYNVPGYYLCTKVLNRYDIKAGVRQSLSIDSGKKN